MIKPPKRKRAFGPDRAFWPELEPEPEPEPEPETE
eukprot:COSAG02_NODE_64319_length_261_cov_0.432099_1_plen_34_part_10